MTSLCESRETVHVWADGEEKGASWWIKAVADLKSKGDVTALVCLIWLSSEWESCLTFLDLVTEQVDLLSSAHTASHPIHPHDLQVGGVRSLWGQKEKQVSGERSDNPVIHLHIDPQNFFKDS